MILKCFHFRFHISGWTVRFSEIQQFPDFLEFFCENFPTMILEIWVQWKAHKDNLVRWSIFLENSYQELSFASVSQAQSTLICFQMKTELFCSGYAYRPHYNAENDHRKRNHSKMLSRVEPFENDAFWKCCFLV